MFSLSQCHIHCIYHSEIFFLQNQFESRCQDLVHFWGTEGWAFVQAVCCGGIKAALCRSVCSALRHTSCFALDVIKLAPACASPNSGKYFRGVGCLLQMPWKHSACVISEFFRHWVLEFRDKNLGEVLFIFTLVSFFLQIGT